MIIFDIFLKYSKGKDSMTSYSAPSQSIFIKSQLTIEFSSIILLSEMESTLRACEVGPNMLWLASSLLRYIAIVDSLFDTALLNGFTFFRLFCVMLSKRTL